MPAETLQDTESKPFLEDRQDADEPDDDEPILLSNEEKDTLDFASPDKGKGKGKVQASPRGILVLQKKKTAAQAQAPPPGAPAPAPVPAVNERKRTADEMNIPPDTQEYFQNLITQASQSSAQAVIAGLGPRLTGIETQVANLSSSQNTKFRKMDERLNTLEKRMKDVEENPSPAPSSAASTISTSAGSRSSRGSLNSLNVPPPARRNLEENFRHVEERRVWHPTYVRVQGFCTDWKKRTGALPITVAQKFINDMATFIDSENKPLLGIVNLTKSQRQGGNNFCNCIEISLNTETENEQAYSLKKLVETLLEREDFRAAHSWIATTIASTPLFVTVESSPWRKPFLKTGNQARQILLSSGVTRQHLKIEFGPPTRVYFVDAEGNASCPEVFKHTRKDGWTVVSKDFFTAWKIHKSVESILEDLNETCAE